MDADRRDCSGLISYPVTPFNHSGHVDYAAFEKLLNRLAQQKPEAICILGSVGESAYLSWDEKQSVIQVALKTIGALCPVFVGINACSTHAAITLSNYAKEKGAFGIMLSPFSYIPLSEHELIHYFSDIAENVHLPIILYNNPVSTGYSLSPEFMVELCKQVNDIHFIKDSSGDISQIKTLLALTGHSPIKIFNGSNQIAFEALEAGVDGWCTAAACFIGEHANNIISHVRTHQKSYSYDEINQFKQLFLFLTEHGLIPSSKAAINYLGFSVGKPRPPIQPLSDKALPLLIKLLDSVHPEQQKVNL